MIKQHKQSKPKSEMGEWLYLRESHQVRHDWIKRMVLGDEEGLNIGAVWET